MPELPDIMIYLDALQPRVHDQRLEQVRIANPFLLRTVDPPIESLIGKRATHLKRLGKRIVIGFEGDLWLIMHLMIAGRLHWKPVGTKLPGKMGLAAFDFTNGSLTLTEAGSKRRASIHLVAGEDAANRLDAGGIDVLKMTSKQFAQALTKDNHTLKRSLTDPRRFSGIGNAYSDEILHHARLSPIKLTQRLTADEVQRLYVAVRETLKDWIARLRQQTGDKFPEGVTAFHPEMAVHGCFGQPCPDCHAPVQRIRYADNETNYCARCQTDGQVLADRSLSCLLKNDWPRSIDEWD
ncbi:Fpg/Nei family DNA glycosylase [Schlesneria paludicola]|uniref:Fpg/Nei family DNA glycosylase n=1 Tax=Schlesneria paludicola TaxID=360056 RepID=UPI00029A0C62|nr:DNA-formamidopyrimidine glycosylase family protein [Schlesneria paludicola]